MRKSFLIAIVLASGLYSRGGWTWYEWPSKEVVCSGFGNPDQLAPGRWVVKTPCVTITFSEDEAIYLLVSLPMMTSAAERERELQRIDRDCEAFLRNICPVWDGAYQAVVQLWAHYEKDKESLDVPYNQYWIRYTSNAKQRSLTITRRKEFNPNRLRSELAKHRQ